MEVRGKLILTRNPVHFSDVFRKSLVSASKLGALSGYCVGYNSHLVRKNGLTCWVPKTKQLPDLDFVSYVLIVFVLISSFTTHRLGN